MSCYDDRLKCRHRYGTPRAAADSELQNVLLDMDRVGRINMALSRLIAERLSELEVDAIIRTLRVWQRHP